MLVIVRRVTLYSEMSGQGRQGAVVSNERNVAVKTLVSHRRRCDAVCAIWQRAIELRGSRFTISKRIVDYVS